MTHRDGTNIESHLGLVRLIVAKMHPASDDDREEMYSDGVLGLVGACDRFDPDRGFELSTFLAHRIRGAILDGRRARDPLARSMRKRVKAIHDAKEGLRSALTREPSRSEAIEASGLTDNEYDDALRAGSASAPASLDGTIHDSETTLGEVVVGVRDTDDDAAPGDVRWLLDGLVGRQRYVVTRRFIYEERQCAIARNLGVTESRVSQICADALDELRLVAAGLHGGPPPRRSRRVSWRQDALAGDAAASYLVSEIGERLDLTGTIRTPHAMEAFAFGATGGHQVNGLAASTGITRRSWHRRLATRGLAGPQHWVSAGWIAKWIYVMWQSHATLRETARTIGGDAGTMSNRCKVATGLRPGGMVALCADAASPWPLADAFGAYLDLSR